MSPTSLADASSDRAKILLIDDEISVCQMLTGVLEAAGFETRCANDFAAVRQAFAEEDFDLVTCDIIMPQVQGLEILRWIGEHRPEVGVVMASAVNDTGTVIDAMRAGALDYLIKPLNVALIVQQLEKAMAHQRQVCEKREYQQDLEDQAKQRTDELQKRMVELERREEEVRVLSRAVTQSPVSVVITDVEGRIEYVNPKFTRLTGYTLEELAGKTPRVLKSGAQDRAVYREMWNTVLGGGEWSGELHNRKKNGELYWERASISAIRGEGGKITHLVAVKEDITERKRTEAVLVETQEQLKRRLRELEGRDRLVQMQLEGGDRGTAYQGVVETIAQVLVVDRVEVYAIEDAGWRMVAGLGSGNEDSESQGDEGSGRGIAVPVGYGEEILAVIWLKYDEEKLGEEVIEMLEHLAREAALVLHMARTVEDVEAGKIEVGALFALDPEGEEYGIR
jgi:PAS domain S-box-containing protein